MSKNVVITGCSSGFGLAMVQAFLNNGWRVIATTRNPENSPEFQQIKHPSVTCIKLDVTSKPDREQLRSFIANDLNNQLDCLINNAGFGLIGIFEEFSEEQIREQLEINTIGLILLTQLCLPALRKSKGRIINISSALGYFALPMYSLYTTSKHAVEGFSESLYYDLAPHGVQVAIIEPGAIKTQFAINIKRPANKLSDEIYSKQAEVFQKVRANMDERLKNTTPDMVAKVAVRLANQKSMPLRTRVGSDAHLVYWLHRLLPAKLFLGMIKQYYKKMSQ